MARELRSYGQGGSRAQEQWSTRRLLKWMTAHFHGKAIDSPRVVAEMLLAHVIGCERLKLYMEIERPASAVELATLRLLVARAAGHEPVQYLVGESWFFGRAFEVDRSTLIPRPSTETLLEHILQWHRASPGHASPLIADIGTGTGCIAVSLAAQIVDAHVIATDIVPESLELARRNAQRHRVEDRIEFRLGAGLEPLRAESAEYRVPSTERGKQNTEPQVPGPDRSQFGTRHSVLGTHPSALGTRHSALGSGLPGLRYDVICSNPPYIPDHEWEAVPANVKLYEPASALRGGADGLDVIRPLIAGAGALLRPGGQLVIEIADCQRDAVIELAKANELLRDPTVLKDHEGLWRVLVAERK